MPMTGLEEMKAAIEEESRVERAEIDRRAQEQAATIGAEAKAAAAARYQEILSDARQACAGELQRAKTGGEMKIKRLLLRTKTELVDETIAMALRQLRELPDADYFTVLQTLACSYARKGEGEMLLSQRDLQRLPAGFADTLNSMLKSQGAQVHIGARGRHAAKNGCRGLCGDLYDGAVSRPAGGGNRSIPAPACACHHPDPGRDGQHGDGAEKREQERGESGRLGYYWIIK